MKEQALNRGGKKLKARKARRAQAGKHYKIPGFDAFSVCITPPLLQDLCIHFLEERIGKLINNITESTKLSLLSRQTYIDFTGGSLLYRLKAFRFASPTLLLNYLCVINPVHKSFIRDTALHIHLKPHSSTLPTKAFQLLSTCTNLQNVSLIIRLPRDMYRFSDVFVKPGTSAALLAAWEGYWLSSNQGVYGATVGLGVDAIVV
ncbi:hypothetical protein WAI453_007241 [Rhynchosporium graminicola]|uniref:Uncharacterized protein n=1 Tax=Rhynchosporium graminicola TaxID=2792576 RepID=A0A1E1LD39_9HELO|nr:uncharacterized protein RCO7_08207 [Rhynchosporium commune]